MFSFSDVVSWTHKMAASGILPTYQRYINGVPIPNTRRILRFREKYIVLLVFAIFVTVCFGGFFFLPELRDRVNVDKLTRGAQQMFLPEHFGGGGHGGGGHNNNNIKHSHSRHNSKNNDNNINDRANLTQGKKKDSDINNSAGDGANSNVKVMKHEPRMNLSKESVTMYKKLIDQDKSILLDKKRKAKEERDKLLRENVEFDHQGGHGVRGGEPSDPVYKGRREKVKQMMKFAWDSYAKYAWGANELKPISKRSHSTGIFGSLTLGASIVDSLDTLYIMGLDEEYKKGRDWVATSFIFDGSADMSVFEINIRFLGGFLSAYAITGDKMFKEKAIDVGNKLLPAFDTPTGVPQSMINLRTGSSHNWGWASGGCSILAEFGSLHLEFLYLSNITGNPIYAQKVMKIRNILQQLERPMGLYPLYLNPRTGKWGQRHFSVGAMGDSFYEYLLKTWLYTGKRDKVARDMYDEAIASIESWLLKTSKSGLKYLAEYKINRVENKMDHLACFAGGMFALGAAGSSNPKKYIQLGEDIAHTCHESYSRTATKLGPESFRFEGHTEAKAMRQNEKYYILRPEVLETYFYMWRFTKNIKYREWGWEAVQALEAYCRTDNGYSGIKDVYSESPVQDDVQQSFFLAETLKYLYMLFSDDSLMPLDSWVFNTEAHPFPIQKPSSQASLKQS
ncbi:mannosyl-oligosaccharide 1,2-alpha-mannosidase IA-like [Argonauta hians]